MTYKECIEILKNHNSIERSEEVQKALDIAIKILSNIQEWKEWHEAQPHRKPYGRYTFIKELEEGVEVEDDL